MSRIEKNQDVQGQVKELKGEVVKEIRKGKKGSRAGLTCSVIFLAVIFTIISWVLWTLAATGIFAIPVFSSIAFSEPKPTRTVNPGASIETVLQEEFATVLTERFVAGQGTITDRSITLPLSERAMTASIRELIKEEGEFSLRAEDAQVVITTEGLEIYIPYDGAKSTALIANVRADVVDGQIQITIQDVYLGSLRVPGWFKAMTVAPVIEEKVPELNAALAQYATLESIEYQGGQVVVTGTFEIEFK